MPRSPEKKPAKGPDLPKIKQVIAASGEQSGEAVRTTEAGTILRLLGSGFGRRAASVRVVFGDLECAPYRLPFRDNELMVTAPLPAKKASGMHVRVGRRRSPGIRFTVNRTPPAQGPPGAASRELFMAVDQLAGLTAAFARASTSMLEIDRPTRETLLSAADNLDGYRAVGLRVVETWMQWLPLQADQEFEPLRTIEFYDEAIRVSGVTDRVNSAIETLYGRGGPVQRLMPGAPASMFVASSGSGIAATASATAAPPSSGTASADSDSSSLAGLIGFILHEITKATEGVENLVKVLKPSVDAVVVDAEFSPGDLISAIAKLLDVVAQILIKIGQSGSSAALNLKITTLIEGVQRLETKGDQQGRDITTLTEGVQRLETKGDQQGRDIMTLLDRTERQGEKLDRAEAKLDQLDATTRRIDETTLRNSEKLDILEAKADRAEGKLDQLLIITGDTRQRLLALIADVQRIEGKIDAIQQDLTFVRSEVVTIHGHVDQLLLDSQVIQNRLNTIQNTLNNIQARLVDIGRGIGDLGRKVDDLQNDVDAVQSVADQVANRVREIDRKVDRLVTQLP